MAGIVYDFHTIPEARARWSSMEAKKASNAAKLDELLAGVTEANRHPEIGLPVEMPSDVDPFDYAYFAPERDPA